MKRMYVHFAAPAFVGYAFGGKQVKGDEIWLDRPYMEVIPRESSVMLYLK